MSDKLILVTGGTGFIGSHLVEDLIRRGEKPLILTRSVTNFSRVEKLMGKLKSINYVDFLNGNENIEIEGVIHLATSYKRFHDSNDIESMISANITVPSQVLEKAIYYGANFILNTSSFFRYSLGGDSILNEDTKTKPYNFYAASKVAFEKMLDIIKDFGLKNKEPTINPITVPFWFFKKCFNFPII